MPTVCQTCGVEGFSELLIYCRGCQIFAEHQYCLHIFPENWETKVDLLCENCSVQGLTLLFFDGHRMEVSKKKNVCPSRNDKKVEVNLYSSSKTQKLRRPKKRLILSDDEISSDEAQSDGIDQHSPRNNISDRNECLMAVASLSKKCAHDQLEERGHPLSRSCENINVTRQKKRLILPDENELTKATPSTCIDKKIPNKGASSLIRSEGSHNISIAQTARVIVPNEVVNRSQTVSAAATEPQEVVHVKSFDAQPNMSCHQRYAKEYFHIPNRPIFHNVWRGYFSICNEKYGPILAHISSRACEKVFYGVTLLTPVLRMEKLSKLDAWPKSFQISPPTDDNIALYFFPTDLWSEAVVDQLLDDIISKDLMLKVTFEEAELLVFASVQLPEHYHRFDGKYYLWGVFRSKRIPVSSQLEKHRCNLDPHAEEKQIIVLAKPPHAEKKLPLTSTPLGHSMSDQLRKDSLKAKGFKYAEMGDERSLEERSSDVNQDFDAGESPNSSTLIPRQEVPPSSIPAVIIVEEKEMSGVEHIEEREEGEICDEASFDASKSGNVSIMEDREEGEICDDDEPYAVFGNEGDNNETGLCLELFPSRKEDIAITGRVGIRSGVDLELGLGSYARDEGKQRCRNKMKFVSRVHLDRAIR